MAYVKQNFSDGNVLTADQLNHIEDGLSALEKEIGQGGTAGGYYTPVVTQPTTDTMKVSYTPSEASMPEVPVMTVNLPKGPAGKDGEDGYTPVKGTDYWTAADKQEMVEELTEQTAPVSYNAQTLTEEQKAQARENIGAVSSDGIIAIPEHWEEAVSEAEQKIIEFQNLGGHDVFTFGFITDTHTDVNADGNFAKLMERVMKACKIPLCLHGGDYISGGTFGSKDIIISEQNHHDFIFRNIEDKLLTALGNHDAVYGVNKNYDSNLTTGEIYNYAFRKNESKTGLVYGESGTYCYKDISAQRVRYIVLNSYDYESDIDENQVVGSNNKLCVSKLGVKQLTWLANTALNVPEGYSIVICSHNAPYRTSDLPAAWVPETTVMVDCEVTLGIVNAFRTKTTYSYSGTLGTGITAEAYDMNFDFSQRQGEIVCWVAGHTHMDGILNLDGLVCVTTANCSAHVAVVDAPNKIYGTDTEYIMDFFCVNKKKNTCNIVRLGAELEENVSDTVISYTNLADTSSADWLTDKRTTSDGSIADRTGYVLSNYIPISAGDIVHIKGYAPVNSLGNVVFYDANKQFLDAEQWFDNPVSSVFIKSNYDDNVVVVDTGLKFEDSSAEVCYMRISSPLSGSASDVIITVDEEIRATEVLGRRFNY